jgi:hypothetical protein
MILDYPAVGRWDFYQGRWDTIERLLRQVCTFDPHNWSQKSSVAARALHSFESYPVPQPLLDITKPLARGSGKGSKTLDLYQDIWKPLVVLQLEDQPMYLFPGVEREESTWLNSRACVENREKIVLHILATTRLKEGW